MTAGNYYNEYSRTPIWQQSIPLMSLDVRDMNDTGPDILVRGSSEAIEYLHARLSRLENAALCDVCNGVEPKNGKPCICGGTGQARDALVGMRKLYKTMTKKKKTTTKKKRPNSLEVLAPLLNSRPGYTEMWVGSDAKDPDQYVVCTACGGRDTKFMMDPEKHKPGCKLLAFWAAHDALLKLLEEHKLLGE